VVCHTKPGGAPFAGGLAFNTAFGTINASNITPDPKTGIGGWTDAAFSDAVRHGVRPDGQHLYPAMPYTSYVKLTDEDVRAIHAYLNTLAPVHQETPPNRMGFPYNQRWLMIVWNGLNFKDTGFKALPGHTAQWNRGAYVATALGHCAECHTPRTLLMGLKSDRPLAGAMVDGWQAFNISPDPEAGIGRWSAADLTRYLHTGAAPGKATAGGAMGDVVGHSLRYLNDADLAALVVYLQSQPRQAEVGAPDRFDAGKPADQLEDEVRGLPLGAAPANGAVLFSGNCASCHGLNGAGGGERYYPSLFHNSVTGAANAANLVQVILHGVNRVNSKGQTVLMPGFGDQLSDAEVASLTNFVASRFGNPALKVSAHAVGVIRANRVAVLPGGLLVAAGLGAGLISLSFLMILWRRRNAAPLSSASKWSPPCA
jgi:mono/diheme cytochrome c family protein